MRRRPDGVHRRGEEEHDTGARVLLLIAGGEARLAARDGGAREEVRCGQRAAAWSKVVSALWREGQMVGQQKNGWTEKGQRRR